jgi:hypothetical protein
MSKPPKLPEVDHVSIAKDDNQFENFGRAESTNARDVGPNVSVEIKSNM